MNIARRSRARLWKRDLDSDTSSLHNSWSLLCKNRFAILPSQDHETECHENCTNLMENWQAYAFFETVQSVGVRHGDHLMMECAAVDSRGDFKWPREAAAKADSDRRDAQMDAKFRRDGKFRSFILYLITHPANRSQEVPKKLHRASISWMKILRLMRNIFCQ